MIQPATLFQWLLGCPAPLEIATLAITFFSAVAFFSYPKSRPPPLTHKTRSNSNLNGARYTPSPNNPNQQLQPQSSGTFDDLTVNILAAESSSGQSFERHDEDPPDLETLVMDCRYSVPPDDPKLTDDILIRMLRARDYKVKDAVKMYWRWKGFREEVRSVSVASALYKTTSCYHSFTHSNSTPPFTPPSPNPSTASMTSHRRTWKDSLRRNSGTSTGTTRWGALLACCCPEITTLPLRKWRKW